MLWDRYASLRLGKPGTTGKEFTGLRLVFSVEMSDTNTPNAAKIDLYNAAPDSIALAQDPECEVRLIVGYKDAAQQIFVGNPIAQGVKLVRGKVDTTLHIEAQDGGRAYGEARCTISYATPTTLEQVFNEIVRQTGQVLGTVRLPVFTFPVGYVYSGQATDAFNQLASLSGSSVFVVDGALQFVEAGGATSEQAIVFSADSGNLIGSPSPKDDGCIEVKGLLGNAQALRPGRVFSVQSRDYNGFFTANSVRFSGDVGSSSNEWYVNVVGTARS